MKNKRNHIFFSLSLQSYAPFFDFCIVNHGTLSTNYLENRLSYDLDTWHIECIQGVDDLIKFWQNSVNIWLNYLPFLTGILYRKAILSTKYLEKRLS